MVGDPLNSDAVVWKNAAQGNEGSSSDPLSISALSLTVHRSGLIRCSTVACLSLLYPLSWRASLQLPDSFLDFSFYTSSLPFPGLTLDVSDKRIP